jgi:hypothetical protein
MLVSFDDLLISLLSAVGDSKYDKGKSCLELRMMLVQNFDLGILCNSMGE